MNLVIVESPAKCKTIGNYLGSDYIVESSIGHIRDLSIKGKGGFGVDINNNFTPEYVVLKDKVEIVEKLKKLAGQADHIYLATDPDREGEAISWHLSEVLKLDREKAYGMHLDIASGTSVRFEPGEEKEVNLVPSGNVASI